MRSQPQTGWARRKQAPCSSQRRQTGAAPWLLDLESLHHGKGLCQEDEYARAQWTPPAVLRLNAEVQAGALLSAAGACCASNLHKTSRPFLMLSSPLLRHIQTMGPPAPAMLQQRALLHNLCNFTQFQACAHQLLWP